MCGECSFVDATFLGGVVDGETVGLQRTPERLHVRGPVVGRMGFDTYDRLDDPDTGEFLGAYLFKEVVGDESPL